MNALPLHTRDGGFSLVEVALALGVAAFCLTAIFGLLPVGVNTNRTSFEQTGAANVASALVADLRATTMTTSTPDPASPYYQIPVPSTPQSAGTAVGSAAFATVFVRQDGTLSGTVNHDAVSANNPHYRVTLYFTATGTANGSTTGTPSATAVRVLVTWPAIADAAYATAPLHYSGSFETVAGLVRD